MKSFYIRVVKEVVGWYDAEDEETAVLYAEDEADLYGYDIHVERVEEIIDELEEDDDVD